VHGQAVGETVTASSLSVAKAFASASALKTLRDAGSGFSLDRLCDCHTGGITPSGAVLGAVRTAVPAVDPVLLLTAGVDGCIAKSTLEVDCDGEGAEGEALDDGTEVGFAAIARQKLADLVDPVSLSAEGASYEHAGEPNSDRDESPAVDSGLSVLDGMYVDSSV
jgi:hypothetical protein